MNPIKRDTNMLNDDGKHSDGQYRKIASRLIACVVVDFIVGSVYLLLSVLMVSRDWTHDKLDPATLWASQINLLIHIRDIAVYQFIPFSAALLLANGFIILWCLRNVATPQARP